MRFSIRDLLWLTALVAVATAWWIDRSRIEEQRSGWYRAYVLLMHETGHVSVDDWGPFVGEDKVGR